MSAELQLAPEGTIERPGPVGRVARLLLAAVFFSGTWALIVDGRYFRNGEPWTQSEWAFTVFAGFFLFPYVLNIGFSRNWGRWPQVGVLLAAAVGGSISYTMNGTVWSSPLNWIVWAWLTYEFAHLTLSFVLAAVLATPGCEMRAVPHLLSMIQGRPSVEHHCPVGPLAPIDRWEMQRRSDRGI